MSKKKERSEPENDDSRERRKHRDDRHSAEKTEVYNRRPEGRVDKHGRSYEDSRKSKDDDRRRRVYDRDDDPAPRVYERKIASPNADDMFGESDVKSRLGPGGGICSTNMSPAFEIKK